MRSILFLLVTMLFSACGNVGSQPTCKSKDSCLTDPNCECWCSVKCGYRKKTSKDHPVYIKDDPNGKHCYCKQWDADHYEDNCVDGKKMKEPSNAK